MTKEDRIKYIISFINKDLILVEGPTSPILLTQEAFKASPYKDLSFSFITPDKAARCLPEHTVITLEDLEI